MKLSSKAEKIFLQISGKSTKLRDLRTIAKDIKKDHELAIELWATKHFFARQLAFLIMDASTYRLANGKPIYEDKGTIAFIEN